MLALLSRKWCYLMMVVEGVLPPSPAMVSSLLLLLLVPPHFSLVPFLLLLGAIPLIHLLLLSLLVVAVPLIAVAWWHTLVQFEHRNWLFGKAWLKLGRIYLKVYLWQGKPISVPVSQYPWSSVDY